MLWWKTKNKTKIKIGACSDTGPVRGENQDAYGCFPRGVTSASQDRLFVVADGMGGHARGREASEAAVRVIQRTYFSMPGQPVNTRLREAFEAANANIFERGQAQPTNGQGAQAKMGTTCTALVLSGRKVHIAHVGDSRAYRITDRHIEQVTGDHTLVEALLRSGVLTEQEALVYPRRNVLTRAMGVEATLEVDLINGHRTQPGEAFLLCTDGLAKLPPEEIHDVVLDHTPQVACKKLVRMANERGGTDNVTVVVVAVGR